MIQDEEFEVLQGAFHQLEWRLQEIFIGWVISVTVFMVGLKLLAANAYMLSMVP